jgi:hypothetical protein
MLRMHACRRWAVISRGCLALFVFACSSTVNVQAGHDDAGTDAIAASGSGGRSSEGGAGGAAGRGGAAAAGAAGPCDGAPCPTRCDAFGTFTDPVQVPGGVNSTDDDFAPRLSADERDMYLARRPLADTTAPTDAYVATRADTSAAFDGAVPLGLNSTTSSDGDAMVTTDGATLFFSSDRPNGVGEFDLHWSTRASSTGSFLSASLVPSVNTDGSELQPFFSADGELWFSYRRAGFTSALHLRRAPRAGLGFSSPVAVTELDSTTDDMWPVLTSDKLTIYYSSMRADGGAKGKADIWVAHRSTPTGTFDPPTNVAELNGAATDLVGWISDDNCRLYLSSNRSATTGYDIYVAQR